MKKIFFLIVFVLLSLPACNDSGTEPKPSSGDSGTRTGAVCNDGTTSSATGSGACSHHGGVKYWLYK